MGPKAWMLWDIVLRLGCTVQEAFATCQRPARKLEGNTMGMHPSVSLKSNTKLVVVVVVVVE